MIAAPIIQAALVFACVALVAGCAGDGPASSPSPTPGSTQTPGTGPTIDAVQNQIFNVYCLTSGCHNAADNQAMLNLEPGASWSNLVNVEATEAAEPGQLLVQPFAPDNSFLITKLVDPMGQGSRMPQGGPFLSENQINMVREWILGGALDTAGPTATLQPSATPTLTPTTSATSTETASPTVTLTPTLTLPPTLTPTGTLAPSASPTVTATPSPTATEVIVTFEEIQTTIFNPGCAVVFCHDTANAQFNGDLDLTAGHSYAALVNVVPDNDAAEAEGFLRVRPFEPDTSFLIVKVCKAQFGEELCPVPFVEEYGSPMPLLGTDLTPAQVEQLRSWIMRGAPETD